MEKSWTLNFVGSESYLAGVQCVVAQEMPKQMFWHHCSSNCTTRSTTTVSELHNSPNNVQNHQEHGGNYQVVRSHAPSSFEHHYPGHPCQFLSSPESSDLVKKRKIRRDIVLLWPTAGWFSPL